MHRPGVMLTIALVVGIAVGMIGNHVLIAQQQPAPRTVLRKTDLAGIEGKEALVLTVAAAPGAVGGNHDHPGHALAYVLEGSLSLAVEGKPPAPWKAGETFHMPPQVGHRGQNASPTTPYKVLVFGLFEQGQPDTTPVPSGPGSSSTRRPVAPSQGPRPGQAGLEGGRGVGLGRVRAKDRSL